MSLLQVRRSQALQNEAAAGLSWLIWLARPSCSVTLAATVLCFLCKKVSTTRRVDNSTDNTVLRSTVDTFLQRRHNSTTPNLHTAYEISKTVENTSLHCPQPLRYSVAAATVVAKKADAQFYDHNHLNRLMFPV